MTIQQVEASMTGTVQRVLVEANAQVEVGQTLAVIESMKMEIPVLAPVAGCIERILVEVGAPVEEGEPLMTLAVR